ncbi:hypothetical protein C8A05DRAFT_35849 [Staphylotrichum tortipilum]|uniref:Uncharacterized protein n=1 Tax=Staphylotrichum tortipilum TaxID=2831512 RepID=A0AAN6MI28_9PEZI|nr:hypothetical protein C8A05DRAFT_35849 [Staphylotrichum longicolle]
MTDLTISVRALLLATLATVGVQGSPIDVASGANGITPCATVKCTSNTTCKVIDGKAQCVPILGVKCGNTVCEAGLTCCNPSCGMCVKPGMMCTQQVCEPTIAPQPVQCGKTLCPTGFVCCNSSCGVCTPPGGACTAQYCTDPV